jgi:hypothetical protein
MALGRWEQYLDFKEPDPTSLKELRRTGRSEKQVPLYLHKPARFMRKSVRKILGIDVKACGARR